MTTVRFLPEGVAADVPPGTTILEAARACGAPVGSACGGNCACSTCHVWVTDGASALSPMEDAENDILDKAFDVRATSRLGCQARVGAAEVICAITPESRKAFEDEHPAARSQGGER